MTTGIDIATLDRRSERYRRFVDRARDLLGTDRRFQRAHAQWLRSLEASHGRIFEEVSGAAPERELFVESLYFDFTVSGLLERLESTLGVTVTTPDSGGRSVALEPLHERIVASSGLDPVGDSITDSALRAIDVGTLRTLYERIVSRETRLALGEYYTPRGVAELAVDSLQIDDPASATMLDPGCGSGVFLSVCIDRKLAALADRPPAETVETVTSSVFGIDLNPVAVKTSTLAYLIALCPVLDAEAVETVAPPVFHADALGLTGTSAVPAELFAGVDYLLGNPPWITWDRLSERVKTRLRERYVDELGLLPHGGAAARLGHSNDDISIPFVWICLDRYLRAGGAVSVVLKRDLLTGPAGAILRKLQVGDRSLSMSHVHDFAGLAPFGSQVGADAALYTMWADTDPSFPAELTAWTGESVDFSTRAALAETADRTETTVAPLDPDDPTSAWIRADAERGALGPCAHEIRHGTKDDAEAVFSVDRDLLDRIEPDLVYPYIKSRHVVKYGLFGHELRLVPVKKANQDNEAELRERYPETYRYLADRREQLTDRASSWLDDGPFYNVFGVGEYTWSPYKVVWCRLGFNPHFAVVSTVEDPDLGEKLVVPGDHYMFIGADDEQEAHALCALLNSAVYQKSLRDIASAGKSSLSKAVVSELALPRFEDLPHGDRLAELSMQAHDIVPGYTDRSKRAYNQLTIEELQPVQAEIDRLVEESVARGGAVER
ncbi:N-6 DNA methylase [Halovenus sp. WSH3]|uniref:N-6 DNA methylase n=1 Tax=Halovenus carboxidivorans TaxID=2692199 RepID=A0A6B0T1D2_9EURY|nr:N-6 DNA methylase [Halovenus carboxidivorans]MXR51745.1 N-6 DNA methylase [Halovenus carboxidivorans]